MTTSTIPGLAAIRQGPLRYVVAAGLAGLLLLFWMGGRSDRAWPEPVGQTDSEPLALSSGGGELADIERAMAASLAEILMRVQGAGRVYVKVTLASGPRTLYERDQQITERATEEVDAQGGRRSISEETSSTTVVVARSSTGDRPVTGQVAAPEVRGVLVVAEGAGDPAVKSQLAAAVAALLDLPPHRIQVVPGS